MPIRRRLSEKRIRAVILTGLVTPSKAIANPVRSRSDPGDRTPPLEEHTLLGAGVLVGLVAIAAVIRDEYSHECGHGRGQARTVQGGQEEPCGDEIGHPRNVGGSGDVIQVRTVTIGATGSGTSVVPSARREPMPPDPAGITPRSKQVLKFEDPVDEMVDESFPASDPPSGWAGKDPRDAATDAGDGARVVD
jgi:hypothetical protein